LNLVDEKTIRIAGGAPFVLVAESQSRTTGLGSRYGSWLLERGLTPRYSHLGATRPGCTGLTEHMAHQGIDPESIAAEIRRLAS